jgi:hypothetical protein
MIRTWEPETSSRNFFQLNGKELIEKNIAFLFVEKIGNCFTYFNPETQI